MEITSTVKAILSDCESDNPGIEDGGANGSIIGRNAFQRPEAEALTLLGRIIDSYLGMS